MKMVRVLAMIWQRCHTSDVKMTMHIDDALLEKAVELSGATSKTAAVDLVLREFVRRGELVKILKAGLGLSADELRDSVATDYDLGAMRLAETAPPYGRKSSAR